MKPFKLFMIAIALSTTPFILSACEDKNAIEEGAEEVSDEIDDAM